MALFKAWFVDFEHCQSEPFKDSEIGKIPSSYKVYHLKDFLPVITGKKNANVSSDKGKYPFFSCSQTIAWTDDYSFDGDAILVAGNGDFNVKFYKGKFEAYQRTYVLIPYEPKYTAWLYYAVKHNLHNITSAARGSVISFITKGNLEDFAFAAPEDLASASIIETFSSINKIIDANIRENYNLEAVRDTLLPKLMSGEIDVSKVDISDPGCLDKSLFIMVLDKFEKMVFILYNSKKRNSYVQNIKIRLCFRDKMPECVMVQEVPQRVTAGNEPGSAGSWNRNRNTCPEQISWWSRHQCYAMGL